MTIYSDHLTSNKKDWQNQYFYKLMNDGEYSQALKIVNEMLEKNPLDVCLNCDKFLLLEDMKDYENALIISTKLLEDHPDADDFYHYQARILYKLERFPEVIKIINQFVKHFGGTDINNLMSGTDDQELIDLFNKSNEEIMRKKR